MDLEWLQPGGTAARFAAPGICEVFAPWPVCCIIGETFVVGDVLHDDNQGAM